MPLNDFLKISIRALAESKKSSIFATLLEKGISIRIQIRAFSSAGSEHLPYKQRVGGSNPSTPTYILIRVYFGRLAHPDSYREVQSIPIQSEESAVQTPQYKLYFQT